MLTELEATREISSIFGIPGKIQFCYNENMADEAIQTSEETPVDIQRLLDTNPHLKSLVSRLGASIEFAETVPFRFPAEILSPEEALMKVSHAKTAEEIGQHGPVMAAWTPEEDSAQEALTLYSDAFFPRDALITALLVKHQYPQLLHTTLKECARLQGTKYEQWSEEEPGKIAHEVRDPNSPRAKGIIKNNQWKFPYYGNIDNTGRFIKAMADYIELNPKENRAILSETVNRLVGENSEAQAITMEQALFDAVMWLKRKMPIHDSDEGRDQNPEALIEFKSVHPLGKGIKNQGWRDSEDGYSDKNGRLANHDQGVADLITNVEAHDALQQFVGLYPEQKAEIEPYINNLRQQIMEKCWVEDEKGGYLALALDRDQNGQINKLDALTPNTGFPLGSKLLKDDTEKQQQIIRRLFSPEMLNSAGIRTLSTDHPLFHPDGYHNGTVWPWYNAVIADNLDTLGYHGLATLLQQCIVRSNDINHKMYFEYDRGDDKPNPSTFWTIIDLLLPGGVHLRAAQPPQPFQAWSIGAVVKASSVLEQKKSGKMPSYAQDLLKSKFETEILESINTPLQIAA